MNDFLRPIYIRLGIVFLTLITSHATSYAETLTPTAPANALPPPSSRAQTLYSNARHDLLQIRVLLKNGKTQASIGSGFLIDKTNLVVTNYHVISQLALEPETYVAEYIDTAGTHGSVQLLAVDAIHDLAIIRVNRKGTGYFKIPAQAQKLNQGQYLYSLGNPLDLGFAISEGAYNGIIKRGFSEQLLFTGSINSGMSGGPNITAEGALAGVNVSKRLDGELVSFLVPIHYVHALTKNLSEKSPALKEAIPSIQTQLMTHQNTMIHTMLDTPLTLKSLGSYLVPVRESDQMRCWGQSTHGKAEDNFSANTINCSMESSLYISDKLSTGHISIRHQFIKSIKLDPIRFSTLISKSFKNEFLGQYKNIHLTAPQCKEDFINNGKLPLKTVLCIKAYRKFSGLYDFTLLVASTDEKLINLQSRLDIRGVSFDNGIRLNHHFLQSIGKQSSAAGENP